MSQKPYSKDVCPPSHSFALDNIIRRWFQNPGKIVGEYIRPGDTVIDLGCGPGFFTMDMARMVTESGTVYSVDLQKEMLEKVRKKALKQGLADRIRFHECAENTIGLDRSIKADFILAYYMVHEVPDPVSFLGEVKPLLKSGGRFLLVEPVFHVSRAAFETLEQTVRSLGFSIQDTPAKKGGRCLLLSAA